MSYRKDIEAIKEDLADELSASLKAYLYYVKDMDKHTLGHLKDFDPPPSVIRAYLFLKKLMEDAVDKPIYEYDKKGSIVKVIREAGPFYTQIKLYYEMMKSMLALYRGEPRFVQDIVAAEKEAKEEGAETVVL
ncbi:MAG: hypothetical protein ACTSPL_03955 [Candidatus Odinarchaeia archaeon]